MPHEDLPDQPLTGAPSPCASCHAPLADDQRYCLHCGAATRHALRDLRRSPPALPAAARPVRRWRVALSRPVPIGRLAALRLPIPTGWRTALARRLPAPALRALAAVGARSRSWPYPWAATLAALACAVSAGVLAGALAGPPAVGSAAPRVVANVPVAPAVAPNLPAGDLGALQAAAPAPPPAPPPPAPASASPSPATDSSAAGDEAPQSDNTDPATSNDDAEADPAKDPEAEKPPETSTPASEPTPPPVKHVVVVALADKSFGEAFGPRSPAPYLARELRRKGALLRRYFATAHGSLPNYLALLSGQAANPATATGCAELTPFVAAGKLAANGEVRGTGCVFDAGVPSLPTQLERKQLTWRAYVDGADPPSGAPAGPCQPPPAAPDATRPAVDRNPFLFLAGVATSADCTTKVTGLATLATDLAAPVDAAPAFSLIVPDACSAGRDGACPPGEPAGLARSDGWLREWIPRLMASPAYADDGMIVITFDQARVSGPEADSTSCCDQALGVNEPESVDPQAPAPGGGRVGALVLSPRVKAGVVSVVPYNHFALLRTIEDAFDLEHLGLAGDDGLKAFGDDVFGSG